MKLISNKMNNLLYNVTITLRGNSDESLIEGFNFVNNGRKAIFINHVSKVNITKNNITEIFKKNSTDSCSILIQGICDDITVAENNIYVNSKLNYTYAISAVSTGFNSKISNNASIRDNTIIMISSGVCEAVFTDILSNSEFISNKINIISDGYAYGLAFANVVGRLSGLNISFNEIIIHSKEMAYLIELHMIDNSTVNNNTLYGDSNGIYAIGVYQSDNISVIDNTLSVFGGDLSKIRRVNDVLGIGNAAISIIRNTNNTSINNNLIYTNSQNPIYLINMTDECKVNETGNYHVLSDKNYDVYFDGDGNLHDGVIGCNNILLLYNLTKNQIMRFNRTLTISSYDFKVPTSATIILDKNASHSIISNIYLMNSSVQLDYASDILISNNILINADISLNSGNNNQILHNNITTNTTGFIIKLNKTKNNSVMFNNFKINSQKMVMINIDDSDYTLIEGNVINASAHEMTLINSSNSRFDTINSNTVSILASPACVYRGCGVENSVIYKNNIFVNGTDLAVIYLFNESSSNNISENYILSFSNNSNDYAVMIKSNENLSNSVVKNYLISSNRLKIADAAVYALFDTVHSNTPSDVYVSSVNGSDDNGDGSKENPYATISEAVKNSLNHSTIHLYGGTYV